MSSVHHDNYPWGALSDYGVRVLDCEHKTPRFLEVGYPYIAIPNIADGRIDLAGAARISEEDIKVWTRRTKPEGGDVVLTRRGRVGDAGVIPAGVECAIGQNLVILRSDNTQIDQNYLRWAMRGPLHRAQVQKWLNVGAVFDSLNVREIGRFEIPIPPLPEQRAIAHVLGTLDDKIELNRQMNQTLEQIAAALFRSWFIDFDPVRAKMAGREPEGMDAATAALFPERLVESEVGEIPEGWHRARVCEVAAVNARTLGAKDSLPEVRYIDISSVSKGEITEVKSFTRGDEPSRARRILRHGDTALSTVRPDRQAYFLALAPPHELIASTGFAVVSPTSVPWSFLHMGLTKHEVFEHLGRVADGGAYPAVRPNVIEDIELVVPAQAELLERFHSAANPLLARMEANRSENVTLADLRETLLPRLLSGELRVPVEPAAATS